MKQVLVLLLILAFALPSHAILNVKQKKKKPVPGNAALALDSRSVFIGFGIGLAVQILPWTRNHVVMPPLKAAGRVIAVPAHAAQRLIRPIPQDKVDAVNRKAAKARLNAQKAASKADQAERKAVDVRRRAAEKLPYDSVDCDNANGNPKLCTVEPDEKEKTP